MTIVRAALIGDGGTNGTTLSAANTGLRAGLPVDSVSVGAGTGLTFDASTAFLGNASIKITTGTTGANVFARWDRMFEPADGDTIYVSLWLRFAALPAVSPTVLKITDPAITRMIDILVKTDGRILVMDQTGATAAQTTQSISTGKWVRVDLTLTPHPTDGKVQVQIYNDPTSAVPTDSTAMIGGQKFKGTLPYAYLLGVSNSSANQAYNIQAYISNGRVAPVGRGWVMSRWVGATTPSGATVTARTLAAAKARLVVSSNAQLTSPQAYSDLMTPDSNGVVRMPVTGLDADTRYYYGIEVDGVIDPDYTGTFRTYPTPGKPASFSFVAGSCAANFSNSETFDTIRNRMGLNSRKALFFQHLGDIHYRDTATNDPVAFQRNYDQVFAASRQLETFAGITTHYTWSDHDSGGPNSDGSSPALPAAQSAYRSRVPSYALPAADGKGIYYSYAVGRVKFIVTDGRSYMSPIAATDNATKTKLGQNQKDWLKNELLDANYPFKVWFHEDAWNNASTFTGDDTWSAYQTERTELANFIKTNAVPVIYVHGDMHALAADDGTNSAGNMPLICAAPMEQTGYVGNGAWTAGVYPTSNLSQTYKNIAWFDVVDTGDVISVRFSGISVDTGETKVSLRVDKTTPSAANPPLWNQAQYQYNVDSGRIPGSYRLYGGTAADVAETIAGARVPSATMQVFATSGQDAKPIQVWAAPDSSSPQLVSALTADATTGEFPPFAAPAGDGGLVWVDAGAGKVALVPWDVSARLQSHLDDPDPHGLSKRAVSLSGGSTIAPPDVRTTPLRIKAYTGTTANDVELLDANGAVVLALNATGQIIMGGGTIYVEAGALKYKSPNGVITTIGPA